MIPAHAAAVRSIRNVVGKYTEIKRGNIGMGLVELDSNQCIKIVADYLPTSSTIAYHLVMVVVTNLGSISYLVKGKGYKRRIIS